MMGVHQPQIQLFSYQVNLNELVRGDHPLRRVAAHIDFSFIRAEVASVYGCNGQVSVDPVILLKLMFLLFWDDVASERELMSMLPERLDYLWFLGYGLDDQIPNHSVLSTPLCVTLSVHRARPGESPRGNDSRLLLRPALPSA